MFDHFSENVGKTFKVRFGNETKTVTITKREGVSLESYIWHGTILETGKKTCIGDSERFISEIICDPELPWFITVDLDCEKKFQEDVSRLEWLLLTIREKETLRLIADLPNIPTEIPSACAQVLREAIRLCKAGPPDSDYEYLHTFDDENKRLLGTKIKLAFNNWDPEFASERYVKVLIAEIEKVGRLPITEKAMMP